MQKKKETEKAFWYAKKKDISRCQKTYTQQFVEQSIFLAGHLFQERPGVVSAGINSVVRGDSSCTIC